MWIPCPRAGDPDDIDPEPMESLMASRATMARFGEPNYPNVPDLTGYQATIRLSDVDISGMCIVPEAEVRIFGTGDADVFDVTDVRVMGTSLIGQPNPLAKILFDALADSITADQAEAALIASVEAARHER